MGVWDCALYAVLCLMLIGNVEFGHMVIATRDVYNDVEWEQEACAPNIDSLGTMFPQMLPQIS